MKKSWLIAISAVFLIVILSYLLIKQPFSTPKSGNNESPETMPVAEGNSLLESACEKAANDYPAWTAPGTDLLIWEDSDKKFNYRTAPENASTGIDSPAGSSETLADMDFVGLNKISYALRNQNNWKIGLLEIKGGTINKSVIYEKQESLDFLDISPIDEREFIIFYTKDSVSYLDFLDTETKAVQNIVSFSAGKETEKLAVSPKGDYAYLLYGNLIIFKISSRAKIDEISSVYSAVWLGNDYLLYSTSEGAFIYSMAEKESNKISKIDPYKMLSFNPKDDGIIAYSSDTNGKIANCRTWQNLNSLNEGTILTFASERTAIIRREDTEQFWRFKDNDWTVKPSHVEILNYATVWKRY